MNATKKARLEYGGVTSQAAMLMDSIGKDPTWKWAVSAEISKEFMDAKAALDKELSMSGFARDIVMCAELSELRKTREPEELVTELRRFGAVAAPLVKTLGGEIRKLLAQQQARQGS